MNNNFIQQNSPDGSFLQSEHWRKFQESAGRKTFHLKGEGFWANIMEHELPIVGKYFYIPRGPIIKFSNQKFSNYFSEIINLAKKNNAGWIRFDPLNQSVFELVKNSVNYKIVKAPHDMQPKEILAMDISENAESILIKMKPKTRYCIRVAQKKGVKIFCSREEKYISAFCDLVEATAKRNGIVFHPRAYYQKMIAAIQEDVLKLYCAEYQGNIIAANLVSFFGNTATYLHGASASVCRNTMAPYLLQWQAILDAKEAGCERYDFGGTNTRSKNKEVRIKKSSWEGITRFKVGFSPSTEPMEFLGSYDVVLNYGRYYLYRIGQHIKVVARRH